MAEHEFDFVNAGRKLRRFFQSQGMREPEDDAQEAIKRLLEKLRETEILNLDAYLMGIAGNIVKERIGEGSLPVVPMAPVPDVIDERLLRCLERCEKKLLNPEERKLLRDWYRGTGGEKIAQRRGLAEKSGTTLSALKERVYRLRQKLAPCVRKCRETIEES